MSCVEAAELLGISERHFRRLSDLVPGGGLDRSAARAGLGAAGAGGPDRIRGGAISDPLLGLHSRAFSRGAAVRAQFFRFFLGYTWKTVMQSCGLVLIAPRGGPVRGGGARRYPV